MSALDVNLHKINLELAAAIIPSHRVEEVYQWQETTQEEKLN